MKINKKGGGGVRAAQGHPRRTVVGLHCKLHNSGELCTSGAPQLVVNQPRGPDLMKSRDMVFRNGQHLFLKAIYWQYTV